MLKKLYKKIDNFIHYWEIWDNKEIITIHWGKLWEIGSSENIKINLWQKVDKILKQEIEKAQNNWFKEIDLDQHFQLIIQFKTDSEWWDEKDLDKRNIIEDILNETLWWTGNGYCDWWDIWSGTINLFSFVVDPDIAIKSIIEELKENKIKWDFIIAKQIDEEIIVLYPENYIEKFEY